MCHLLHELASELAPILKCFYQKSLNSGELPGDWLKANVTPIYKKGDRHRPENYRPVSLTCVASKLMEHIIAKQILTHLENHTILSRFQHGFRQRHSCETQLLITLNDFYKYWDMNKQLDVGVLDFSKAFDTVPHDHLLGKLDYYGINGNVNTWIAQFLKYRTQRVLVDGTMSDAVAVDSGVPQGTVLGPLLFLIYINDLPSVLSADTRVRLFADDCIIYRKIEDESDQTTLQRDLDALHQWSVQWGMPKNVTQCKYQDLKPPCPTCIP